MADAGLIDRWARVLVEVGLRLERGQLVAVDAYIEQRDAAVAVARAAYAAGARYVDVHYFDLQVKRARADLAPIESLAEVPDWLDRRYDWLAEAQGAFVRFEGSPDPGALRGVAAERLGRDELPISRRQRQHARDGAIAWLIVAPPTPGWATAIFGEPDVDRLWEAVGTALRLDAADPVAAWHEHLAALRRRSAALNAHGFDAIRFHGGGSDLTIGLLPGSRFKGGTSTTAWGHETVVNMPTDEVFTTPDRRRADGTLKATRDIVVEGVEIRGLELQFAGGRIVRVRADAGAELIEAQITRDEGAGQVAEVALVDLDSPVARTGLLFNDILYDENAACHVAFGQAYPDAVEGAGALTPEQRYEAGLSASSVHTDVMLGSAEVDVDGLAADGTATPVIRDGRFTPEFA